MEAVPSPFRFPISRGGPTPVHLLTTAAALRLGDILHLQTRHHLESRLHVLLRSSFKGFSHFGHVYGLKNAWLEGPLLFKGFCFLESPNDSLSTRFKSYLCFFSAKDSKTEFGDEGKSYLETPKRRPPNGRLWTNVLLALNILVYVVQIATQGKLLLWGAKINSLIDKGQLWRLATSSFLHGNVGHLMVNCYSLNSVGPMMENISGPRRFLAVYFTSAIASSAMSYWFCKAPAVGASGAIFGLVGSFAMFVLRHRNLYGGGNQELQQIANVIALNMMIGILSKGIDNWGHLGGFLGGVATSWLLGPAWKYKSRSNDGKLVFSDSAPIFYLIDRKRAT
ncbi:PREDICTED: RHOMBOID-like protein 10, chloroplastic [Nelumbo nucifera]|uniref:RHOMBOID-like protein 10, chloroplastic n=1 Tax=Nelumbo nucifera TaxID=4432 RepID=A0A1U8B121_NELNU|nr:PREDICTED: RHOMBOID-like protein 10, chloroplastic [Nelumbo nucifera]XP_010272794.1 PREDICTED: RHOMBOID-like protein 10, chloroplastic [Nelumbo nucifera]